MERDIEQGASAHYVVFPYVSSLRNVKLLNGRKVADSGEVDMLEVIVLEHQAVGKPSMNVDGKQGSQGILLPGSDRLGRF